MTQFDNNLSGALFRNEKKEKPNQPDYRGQCEINGEEFWISAWLKDSKKGKFMSLAFEAKEEQRPSKAPVKQAPRKSQRDEYDEDSDVPF